MSTQCPTKGKTSKYNCYMLTHRLQTTPGSHFAIVDSGTPIHIVFDHLFVSNTREDHTPVTGFSGNASRATHKGDMNARVRTNNNEYINLVDVNSTLVVPDCVRRLYSVRQATHKGYQVLLDSHKPGLWVCEHFIPFVNDPDTNSYHSSTTQTRTSGFFLCSPQPRKTTESIPFRATTLQLFQSLP